MSGNKAICTLVLIHLLRPVATDSLPVKFGQVKVNYGNLEPHIQTTLFTRDQPVNSHFKINTRSLCSTYLRTFFPLSIESAFIKCKSLKSIYKNSCPYSTPLNVVLKTMLHIYRAYEGSPLLTRVMGCLVPGRTVNVIPCCFDCVPLLVTEELTCCFLATLVSNSRMSRLGVLAGRRGGVVLGANGNLVSSSGRGEPHSSLLDSVSFFGIIVFSISSIFFCKMLNSVAWLSETAGSGLAMGTFGKIW